MKRSWDMFSGMISSVTKMTKTLLEIREKAESSNIFYDEEKMRTLRRKLQELEDIKADAMKELETAEWRTGKTCRSELQSWFSNAESVIAEVHRLEEEAEQGGFRSKLLGKRVEKMIQEVKELIDKSGRFPERLILDACDGNGVAFLAPKLVGQEFEINRDKMSKWLMVEEGLTIAVLGMAGVGKTTLVTHIHNQLLRTQKNVYWITVPQNIRIDELQDLIANAICFHISNDDDEKKRAALLWNALNKRPKFVLILDNLWEHFPLEKVGIPISRDNGCKLIVTSRSLEVCNKMNCNKKIKVMPLSDQEAWNLFQEILGEQLPVDVCEIAKCIVRECNGLPLGIITMAGCMRGVDDLSEWRDTLRYLQESKFCEGDDINKVFQILKYSYDHLGSLALKMCFLRCALYPENFDIRRVQLIDYLIAEGVIEESSRKAEFDKGNAMLSKLERVGLLEGFLDSRNNRCVRMHDLNRDMAIQIMKPDTLVCTESELLNCKSWPEDIVRISSMNSCIEQIPSNHFPNCPQLSTLWLHAEKLEFLPDLFFEQLRALEILDLSTGILNELPNSVSDLSNLVSLNLKCCTALWRVPSLEKFKRLKKLNLCFTRVQEVQGLGFLSNLKYLGLFRTLLKELQPGILRRLPCLQVLLLDPDIKNVKAEEVACLRKLEVLCWCFHNFNEFNTFFQSSKGLSSKVRGFTSHQLNRYCLLIGEGSRLPSDDKVYDLEEELEFVLGERVILGNCSIKRCEDAPQELFIEVGSYHRGRLHFEDESTLQELKIFYCTGMEFLFSLSSSLLQNLEVLQISDSMDLRKLFFTTAAPAEPNGAFYVLKILKIWRCPIIKKLFPHSLLLNLQNLKEIYVGDCEKMEELIAIEGQEQESDKCSSFALPKLASFRLMNLPELKSICSGKMICNCLEDIWVHDCPKVERVPISLLSLDNGQPRPLPFLQQIDIRPQEWWKMVELDNPNAKISLSYLVNSSR